MPQLAGWQNFYVIVGSSAGALIGLQFVVIALFTTSRGPVATSTMRAFATPTIVYFSSVVIVAGLLNVPHHTRTSLGVLLTALGVFGLGYIVWVGFHMHRQDGYTPDLGDRIWFIVLPSTAYAAALLAGILMWSAPRSALNVEAASTMLLLLIGVHNCWDSAVYMVANPPTP